MMCEHEWTGKSGTVQCKLCQAVGLFDTDKDPFGENEVVILRPPQEEWEKLNRKQRHAIIENNRYHILVDVRNMDRPATERKWSLSKATLYQFLARRSEITKAPVLNSNLPPLPSFDSNWTSEVQVKWLEIYGKLCGSKSSV